MRFNPSRTTCGALLVLTAMFTTACEGVWQARSDGPTTSQTRREYEWVPNAALARQDTSPILNGRYVFVPGADRLLVISQITSWADRPPKGKEEEYKDRPLPQKDRQMERVWITIPFDAQVGQELKLEDIEDKFLAGYDRGDIERGMFIEADRLRGFVRVMEIRPTEVVVNLEMLVECKGPTWSVHDVLTVPIRPDGLRAGRATTDRVTKLGHTSVSIAPPAAVSSPSPSPTPVPAAVAPKADAAAAPVAPVAVDPNEDPRLIGKWEGLTNNYNIKYQFGADGRFYSATTPRTGEKKIAIVAGGRYELRGDTIILRIDTYTSSGRDLRSLLQNNTMVLRHTYDGDALTLSGDLEQGHGPIKARLEKGHYDDLKALSP
ncbi:MAG: hypothetical protein K8S99_09560 [Planctomycetes bacterium]|nr:hypothetical protein [Planctomycetota bacterium]